LAPLDEDAKRLKTEGFCGLSGNDPEFNRQYSGADSLGLPKSATPSEELALLATGQEFCGTQGCSAPKSATQICGEHLRHAAAQQNTASTDARETNGCTTSGYPICRECGLPIAERLETWWGGERCHRACGEAAWRREWRGKASSIHFQQ
jgi:hypothetical protein